MIVGRAADHVLKDRSNVVRVFIHAPIPYRINRVMEVYKDSLREAKRNIRRSDKARASYYRHISGKRWGEPDNYELTIDSSCGIEKSVDQIMQYLEKNSTGLCTNLENSLDKKGRFPGTLFYDRIS